MRLRSIIATVAMLLALPVAAQDAVEKIKAELKKTVPEAPVESVRKTPYGGLYEVVVNGEIFYTDEKASFIVVGSLINLQTKENITEARLRQVNRVAFNDLPFDRAIKIVRGDGSRKIAIFEDPNCGYCKRFERDLQGVNDITVYVFLYPILSPDSVEKSKAIWCSKDATAAWRNWMVDGTTPPKLLGDCATPLDRNLELSRKHRVSGTPAIVFENGVRVPGMLTADQLEQQLASNSKG